jgi:hypothetical protein
VDAYLAALIVRNPRYLDKIVKFHELHGHPIAGSQTRDQQIKTIALENMLYVFEIYRERISASPLGLLFAEGAKEFIFSDGGLSVSEPWGGGMVPFEVHAPLTPRVSIEILPLNRAPAEFFVMGCTGNAVSRLNRLALASANRFVFCRGTPPTSFIRKHFGTPVPWVVAVDPRTGWLKTYDKPDPAQ